MTASSLADWHPTADEVAAIVAEMRPIIRAHAAKARSFLSPMTPDTGVSRDKNQSAA